VSVNSFNKINPALIDAPLPPEFLTDGHPGYPDELKVGDTLDVLKQACGNASREFPQKLWIEPKDWPDKARENDKYHTWPLNFVDRYTHQAPTHECTTHALRALAEGCRNRQRGIIFPSGPKKGERYAESSKGSVWLSPLSIYAEANPRQWGGAGCRQVLEIAVRRGFLPEKIQPRDDYGFKHTLQGTTGQGNSNQSRGDWVSLSRFPEGWLDTAKWFKPQEVIFTDSWEQVVCLVLHGYLVEVGRSGHAIPYAIWNPQEKVMGYVDSYDTMRYDSLRTVQSASSGAFAIASMTSPDDWLHPAGLAL
jgi:hypothetical protein